MLGIGVDLVDVARIEKAFAKNTEKFPRRILSPEELEQFLVSADEVAFLAKRFAAKEAVAKALGTGFSGGVSWTDISLDHDELGKPYVNLFGAAEEQFQRMGATRVLVSLSDEAGLVIAYANVS
ncbi:hypothetical protein A3742_28480 [Oleiphilus sp. HI0071]|uniref:holo-ACP synthase n=1 Tax=unclassified Oleiphilus TaxID=2631174 RepID=UPI0007C2EFB1|nr:MULTISPECIES: holo-ACP synthase [unclassified Oleiphilus]KZY62837.1 hypothetical protein A3737_19615 [Oleiphilus sp. HI0065]KZY81622.1 hypothetical protein A3742_11645 [Oleiphilus sp. HI0071]KZY99481.1 hypothetical protein A3744_30445 [Oleiphilus sp. HI0073]KZZ40596.1 hypothetical protein A3758_07640 [Oleiphilus sp. HI0118]KZZ52225.1 hypothetical protein A3760_10595 [Oleiphilus sp. HI0122]KZZ67508.1 hypothetical protein A3765_04520 [Oleiphilus sp. HI0130]KZZ78754.1 hypothetical protein A3